MNWDRAKSILIVFFLLINVCLFGILIHARYKDSTLPESVIRSTTELLNQNGIAVKSEIIPKSRFKNQNYNLTTLQFGEEENIEKWLGAGYRSIEKDSSAYCFVYQNENRHLAINKTNLEFYIDKNTLLFSQQEEKNMEDLFSSKLKKFGFYEKEYYFRSIWFENGLYHCIISPVAEKTKVTGIELKVSMDKEEIIRVSGNWFRYSGRETFADEGLLDITAVMANLIYLENRPIAKLTEISCIAYVSKEYLDNKIVTAVPVYSFSFADGQVFYYDARSGELIQ